MGLDGNASASRTTLVSRAALGKTVELLEFFQENLARQAGAAVGIPEKDRVVSKGTLRAASRDPFVGFFVPVKATEVQARRGGRQRGVVLGAVEAYFDGGVLKTVDQIKEFGKLGWGAAEKRLIGLGFLHGRQRFV